MHTKIIKIGNSRGIRIPAPMLKESGIEGNVELKMSGNGLVIRPAKNVNASANETVLLSEKTLAYDWNRPEEDEAWINI